MTEQGWSKTEAVNGNRQSSLLAVGFKMNLKQVLSVSVESDEALTQ